MLEVIPAAEVALPGKALEVRHRPAPGRPGLVIVTVLSHAVEGGQDHVRRSELALVVMDERMGREAMRARVAAEARRLAIGRVAWVEEA
jgi:hypothetical protein